MLAHPLDESIPARAERIFDALGGSKCADGYMVHCPAHEDRTPSLHVSVKGDRLLIRCHAGCENSHVIDALRDRGLWPVESQARPPIPMPTATSYGYFAASGEKMTKERYDQIGPGQRGKRFEWFGPDGKRGLRGRTPLLYRSERLGAIPLDVPIDVFEGEKCVQVAEGFGLVAVSIPGGASAGWRPEWVELLRDRQVRLWPDNDEAGRKQAEKAVRALLGVAASVYMVDIPDLPEKGDIADWEASGGNRDQLVQVVAQARRVESARSSDSYMQYVSDVSALLAKDLPPLREVIPGLLIEGLTVFGGRSKMGKSILVGNLAVAVATGGIALGRYRIDQADALLIALEDGERRLQRRFRRWLEGCGAIPLEVATKWPRVHEGGLEMIEAWLKDHPNASLVIIDHLELFRAPTDGRKRAFSEDYDATRPLTELATQYSVPILLVHHLNQREAVEDPMQLLSGTEGLPAGVDTAWILQRKRGAPGAELHVHGRDVEGQELALEFDKESLTWSQVDASERLSDPQRETINAVRELGGCGPKELAEFLDIPESTARKRLHDYRQSGLLEQTSLRSKYTVGGNEGNEGNVPLDVLTERYEGYPRYLNPEVALCRSCGSDAMRELPAGGWKCDSCQALA